MSLAFLVAHANPRQGCRLLFPEVLVLVEAHLIDFQSLSVVLVVQLAKHEYAGRRLLHGKDVEVEQHDAALQVGQPAQLAAVVGHGNVDDSGLSNDGGVDGLAVGRLAKSHVPHSLQRDVVEVGATLGIRPEGVPAGGHGGKHLDVFLVGAGIEDERIAKRLEQGEVGIRLAGFGEDVLHLHLLLVAGHEGQDAVVRLVDVQLFALADGQCLAVECLLAQGQFLDFLTVFRAADLVLRGHLRILCLDGDRLGRVDGHIDYLVADAQAVELRCLGALTAESERTVVVELDGVEDGDVADAHVLEVQHLVLGIGYIALHMKLFLTARSHRQCGHGHHNIFLHSHYYFYCCQQISLIYYLLSLYQVTAFPPRGSCSRHRR